MNTALSNIGIKKKRSPSNRDLAFVYNRKGVLLKYVDVGSATIDFLLSVAWLGVQQLLQADVAVRLARHLLIALLACVSVRGRWRSCVQVAVHSRRSAHLPCPKVSINRYKYQVLLCNMGRKL